MQTIPQRATDSKFIASIEGFKGNLFKLGRLIKHDWFNVSEVGHKPRDRYLFLFKARILITKVKRISDDRSVFILKDIIRLPETSLEGLDNLKSLEFHHIEPQNHPNYPISIEARSPDIKDSWLDIVQEHVVDTASVEDLLFDDEIRVVTPEGEEEERVFLSPAAGESEGLQELPENLLRDLPEPQELPSPRPVESTDEQIVPQTAEVAYEEAAVLEQDFWAPKVQKPAVEEVEQLEVVEGSAKRAKEAEVDIWETLKTSPPSKRRATASEESHTVVEESYSSSNFYESSWQVKKEERFESSGYSEEVEKTSVKRSKEEAEESDFWSTRPASPPLKKRAPSIVEEASEKPSEKPKDKVVDVKIKYEKKKKVEPEKVEEEEDFWAGRPSSPAPKKPSAQAVEETDTSKTSVKQEEVTTKTTEETVSVTKQESHQKVEKEESVEDFWSSKPSSPPLKKRTPPSSGDIAAEDLKEVDLEQVEKVSANTAELAERKEEKSKEEIKQDIPAVQVESDSSKVSKQKESKVLGRKKSDTLLTKRKSSLVQAKQEKEVTETEVKVEVEVKFDKQEDEKVAKKKEEEVKVKETKKVEEEEKPPSTPPKSTKKKSVEEVKFGADKRPRLEEDKGEKQDVSVVKKDKEETTVTLEQKKTTESNKERKESLESKKKTEESTVSKEESVDTTTSKKEKEDTLSKKKLEEEVSANKKEKEATSSKDRKLSLVSKEKREETLLEEKKQEETTKKKETEEKLLTKTETKKTKKETETTEETTTKKKDETPQSKKTTEETLISKKEDKESLESKKEYKEPVASKKEKKESFTTKKEKEETVDTKKENEKTTPTKKVEDKKEEKVETTFTKKVEEEEKKKEKEETTADKKVEEEKKKEKEETTVTKKVEEVKKKEETKVTKKVEEKTEKEEEKKEVPITKEETEKDSLISKRKPSLIEEKKATGKETRKKSLIEDKKKVEKEEVVTKDKKVDTKVEDKKTEPQKTAPEEKVEKPAKLAKDARRQSKTKEVEDDSLKKEKVESVSSSQQVKSKTATDKTETMDAEPTEGIVGIVEDRPESSGRPPLTTVCAAWKAPDSPSSSKPVFTKTLTGDVIEPGDSTHFDCEVSHDSSYYVTWLRNNKPLEDKLADRVQQVDDGRKHSLKILNCRMDDSGTYTAKVTDTGGVNACSTAHLLVQELSEEERSIRLKDKVPFFLVKMKDAEVIENSNLSYAVHVKGDPMPKVSFKKNGVPLEEDERVQIQRDVEKGHYELIFTNVRKEDAGVYQCTAINKHDKAVCEAELTVQEEEQAMKNLAGKGSLLKPGEAADFTWFRDGVQMDPVDRFNVLFKDEEDTLALVFQNVTPDDAGIYTCVASTSCGKISCSAELTVEGSVKRLLKDPAPPVFVEPLADSYVSISGTAMLECSVTGYPKPTITWMRNMMEINISGRYKVLWENEENVTLVIKNVEDTDKGMYTALAVNEIGEADCSAKLIIKAAPKFHKIQKEVAFIIDKPLMYMVDVDGEPVPELMWMKDGKPIQNDRFSFGSDGEGTFHMKIDTMKIEDCGCYQIIATNDLGQRTETFEIQAETPPEITKELDPEIEKKIMNDQTFEVRCKGNPAPVATWYKDGKELSGSERIKISRDEQFYQLRIRKIDRNDKGVYKVVLKNTQGEAESSCNFIIRAPPFFTTPMKDACSRPGEKDIKMFVQWEANPRASVKWFFKDRQITETMEYFSWRTTDETSLLTIKEASEDMVGTYTLKASNEYGDSTCKARFRLHCTPEILDPLKDAEFLEDQMAKFTCRVHGVPVPEIKWTKDGKKFVPDEKRVKITKDDEDTYVILIEKAKTEDSGHYACVVSNCEGKVEMEADLLVCTPPHILSNNFSEGKTYIAMHKLVLEVEATGVPEAEATWTLDGRELKEDEDSVKFTFDGKYYKMERLGSDPEQTGTYKCVLKNKIASAEVSGQITIIEKEARVRQPLKDCNIKEYTDGTIQCQIVGDPIPSVEWLRNGKPLPISERFEVREERDKRMHYLTFKRLEERDKCTFTCRGKNEHGECETSCTMAVWVKPQPGEIQDTTVDFGGDLLLTLFIHAIPPPDMDWYQNGTRRDESDRIEYLRKEDQEIYSLKVTNVTLEDAGNYTYKASNAAGEAEGKVAVKVHTEKPTIVEHIDDISVCLEDSVTFKIKGAGLPLPEVEWKNKNVTVNNADRYTTTRPVKDIYTITLTDLRVEDYGEITAIAKNLVGEAVSKAKLLQKKLECKIMQDLEHITKAPEGEEVTLKVLIQASPRPQFSWYRDGDKLKDGDKYKIGFEKVSPSEGYLTLTLLEATAADSGQFRVKANNELNEVSTETALIVRPVRKSPRITKKPEDFSVVCMKPGMFKAKIVGYPKPEVQWMKEGREVLPTDICSSGVTADGFYYLEFKHVTMEDAGRYTVVAKNEEGSTECDVKLTVAPYPSKPEFLQGLVPTKVIIGYPARMELVLGGSPKPTVTWLKDGEPLRVDGQHIRQIEGDDGAVYLQFDKAVPEDAGEYTAVATNSEGENRSSSPIEVLDHERTDGQDGPAQFGEELKDSTFDEGKTIRLPVTVKGGPVPDMKWYKDGKEIALDDRTFFTYDGDKTFLEIHPCVGADSGIYKCVINNEHGEASTECEVSIRKCFEPPVFLHGFVSQQQLPGRDAKLSIKIDGVPKPELEWYFKGKPIKADGEKYRIRKDADGCTLIVRNCKYGDTGEYKVVATNREGAAEHKGTLTVADEADPSKKAEAPVFLKVIGDQELYMNYTARFKAVVTGHPTPEFEWLHNGEKLHPNSRVISERDTEGMIRLTIQHVIEQDSGVYTLKVWNEHGKASCKGKLICECISKDRKRPVGDEYQGFDKLRRSGVPIPLPETPIISALSDKRATITWIPFLPSAPMPPVTYQLEMCECPEGDWFTGRTGIRGCSVDITNLNPKSDYRFRVRVENKHGVSEPSPYVTTFRNRLERYPVCHEPFLGTDGETYKDGPYVPPGFIVNRDEKGNFWAPPRFLRLDHDDQYGTKDFNARVKWIAYGYPTPKLRFYFNDKEIKFTKDPRYSFVQEAEGDIFLFIEKVTKKDAGVYKCYATNEYGESHQNINFDLCEYPRITQHLQETYMRELTSGKITCKIAGYPPCDVKWFKDWEEIPTTIKLKHHFVPPDTYILNFHGPIVKDSGLYSLAAVNVAGAASSSCMVHVIEDEENNFIWTGPGRGKIVGINTKKGTLEDHYDIGDELGRGTQGVVYHCAEHYTGRNFAAKSMWGKDNLKDWMRHELEMMNSINSCPYIVRLYDAYESDKNMVLVEELCAGGELLPFLTQQQYITEYDIAHYIRQILEGLDYMHDRCIAHCGLNLGDIMLTRCNGRDIKFSDLSLARNIRAGKLYPLDYGMPEYVAPEVAKGENINEKVDMWSVGIITYILLAGISPFRGENDRETLTRLQKGELFYESEAFEKLSEEAKDFIAKLLQYKPEMRMDVKAALLHPWISFADQIPRDPPKIYTDRLRTYYSKFREWYANASCRRWFRRRTLGSAFTHPSKMVYPPGEIYTPEDSPCRELVPYKPKEEDYSIPYRDLSYEIDVFRNDSQYQSGPDTYLLQLRDPDFPVRLRQYMKIAEDRSPSYALTHRSEGYDYEDVKEHQMSRLEYLQAKRERRKRREPGEFKSSYFVYPDEIPTRIPTEDDKDKIAHRSQAMHRAQLFSKETYKYRRHERSTNEKNFKGSLTEVDRSENPSDKQRD